MTTFSYDDYSYLRYALELARDRIIDLDSPKDSSAEIIYIKALDTELKRRMHIMERKAANGNKGQKSKG